MMFKRILLIILVCVFLFGGKAAYQRLKNEPKTGAYKKSILDGEWRDKAQSVAETPTDVIEEKLYSTLEKVPEAITNTAEKYFRWIPQEYGDSEMSDAIFGKDAMDNSTLKDDPLFKKLVGGSAHFISKTVSSLRDMFRDFTQNIWVDQYKKKHGLQ